MNQAGRMCKLGTSKPRFPWHRHSVGRSARECVIVINEKLEVPEEQKGDTFQRRICSAVFVVDIIACSVQEVPHQVSETSLSPHLVWGIPDIPASSLVLVLLAASVCQDGHPVQLTDGFLSRVVT